MSTYQLQNSLFVLSYITVSLAFELVDNKGEAEKKKGRRKRDTC